MMLTIFGWNNCNSGFNAANSAKQLWLTKWRKVLNAVANAVEGVECEWKCC